MAVMAVHAAMFSRLLCDGLKAEEEVEGPCAV